MGVEECMVVACMELQGMAWGEYDGVVTSCEACSISLVLAWAVFNAISFCSFNFLVYVFIVCIIIALLVQLCPRNLFVLDELCKLMLRPSSVARPLAGYSERASLYLFSGWVATEWVVMVWVAWEVMAAWACLQWAWVADSCKAFTPRLDRLA
jgi:hypothetical protein